MKFVNTILLYHVLMYKVNCFYNKQIHFDEK